MDRIKGRLTWVGHSSNFDGRRLTGHGSGNELCKLTGSPMTDNPTHALTVEFRGVTNPVESTLAEIYLRGGLPVVCPSQCAARSLNQF